MDYGGRFDPILVAVVGAIGTCMAGLIDYTVITYILKFLSAKSQPVASSLSDDLSAPASASAGTADRCSHRQKWRDRARRYISRIGPKYYEKVAKLKRTRSYKYCAWLYNKVAFISLVIAGFTPIPFEPFRFLAVAAKYNRGKYVLAIFIGRAPRYYLLAKLQDMFHIRRSILIGSILLIFVIVLIWNRITQKKA